MQVKFRTIRTELEGPDGVEKLIQHLSLLNGERPGDAERTAHEAALFDYQIRKAESLTEYMLRRDAQVFEAEKRNLALPDS
eukprot:7295518-Pyramimonas_sp.AAC.1